MNIAIVGAGLGGLAAAICLAKAGHKVTVFERRAGSSPQGGIIALRPSALKVLYSHGLKGKLDSMVLPLGESQFRMLHDGTVVRTSDLHEDQVAGEGLSMVTTRPKLGRVLLEGAIEAGAAVKFGVGVSGFEESEATIEVKLEDESTFSAHLMLAADGIRSRLRSKILGDDDREPVVTDATFYVFTLPASLLPPDVKARMFESNGPWIRMNAWLGKDSWAMSAFDNIHDTVDVGATIVEPTSQTSLWDEDGDVEYVREYFKSRAFSDIQEALKAAPGCDRWRLAYMPDLPRWTSKRGRVALLGDSAHAILPNGGAGITLTIEDVGALSHLFNRYRSTQEIPETLRIWQKACKPRANKLREFGCFNMRRMQGDKEALMATEKALKEEAMGDRKAAKPDQDAQWSTLAFARWLSGYDPIAAVDKVLQQE